MMRYSMKFKLRNQITKLLIEVVPFTIGLIIFLVPIAIGFIVFLHYSLSSNSLYML